MNLLKNISIIIFISTLLAACGSRFCDNMIITVSDGEATAPLPTVGVDVSAAKKETVQRIRQNLIFEEHFDGDILDSNHWRVSGNAPRVETVDGKSVLVAGLDRYNDANTYRTEVTLLGLPISQFDYGIYAKAGETYWYGVSIFIPDVHAYDTSGEKIMQWHGVPDDNENYRNPMLSLGIYGDTYRLNIAGDYKEITPLEKPRYDRSSQIDIASVSPTVGKWTNWVFRIKWGCDKSGELTVYQNGVGVFSEQNKANCYNDIKGPYFKMGVYKWPWKEGQPETETNTRCYYYDNLRIGNSIATLQDVME